MDPMMTMLKLLCTQPELTNIEIGRLSRRTPRTVARYRKNLLSAGVTWADVINKSRKEVYLLFNKAKREAKCARPKISRVHRILRAGGCQRSAWHDYLATSSAPHLTLSSFLTYVRPRFRRRHYYVRVAKPMK